MNKAQLLRAISDENLRDVIEKALSFGWEPYAMTGSGSYRILWRKTREKVTFAGKPSDGNAYKNVARNIEKISGLVIIPKHNKTRSHRDPAPEPKFVQTHESYKMPAIRNRVLTLLREHKDLCLEFAILKLPGDTPNTMINRAFTVVRRIDRIETLLKELHQPIPAYDFMDHQAE